MRHLGYIRSAQCRVDSAVSGPGAGCLQSLLHNTRAAAGPRPRPQVADPQRWGLVPARPSWGQGNAGYRRRAQLLPSRGHHDAPPQRRRGGGARRRWAPPGEGPKAQATLKVKVPSPEVTAITAQASPATRPGSRPEPGRETTREGGWDEKKWRRRLAWRLPKVENLTFSFLFRGR